MQDQTTIVRDLLQHGYTTALRLSARDLKLFRDVVEAHWLGRLKNVAPDKVEKFRSAGMERYHEVANLIDHTKTWAKKERLLPADAIKKLRQADLFKNLEEVFGPFPLSDEEELGWENLYWRIVRPNHPGDIGPLHADHWFWELSHTYIPPNTRRFKIWLALFCEPGLSGLRVVPDSHLKNWNYNAEARGTYVKPDGTPAHGYMKPLFDEKAAGIDPILVSTVPGDTVLFDYGLLHGGAVSRGVKTRISAEFTLFVNDEKWRAKAKAHAGIDLAPHATG